MIHAASREERFVQPERETVQSSPVSMEEIMATYSRTVYSIALAKTHMKEDAEDIFQEVFLSFVRKQPVFRDERQGRVWFSKATVYACKMFWRSKKRHETLPIDAAEGIVFQTDEDREVLMELSNLPAKFREVLELFYFGGLSTEEIAKVVGSTPNAVRIRLSRARTALEERLSDKEDL